MLLPRKSLLKLFHQANAKLHKFPRYPTPHRPYLIMQREYTATTRCRFIHDYEFYGPRYTCI